MSSYLQTLRNLQQDTFTAKVVDRNIVYDNYEDYLHQLNSPKTYIYQHPRHDHIIEYRQPTPQKACPQCREVHLQSLQSCTVPKGHKDITYVPVERKVVEYVDHEVKTKVPITKKIIEYKDQKQVEIHPRQVIKTDYYAVETVRRYLKEVVPQVKIETVKVPKIIKKTEFIPVQKQTVIYPQVAGKSFQETVKQAQSALQKQGIPVKGNAVYVPATQHSHIHHHSPHSPPISVLTQSTPKPILKKRVTIQDEPRQYYKQSPIITRLKDTSDIPIFNQAKYKSPSYHYIHSRRECRDCSFQNSNTTADFEYSFADRDRYRYNKMSKTYDSHKIY